MPEASFYHLERSSLEKVLPELLARSLERGWRVVVKVGSDERLQALNAHLWTYDDASFLPHGGPGDGSPEDQPIWLTTGDDNPNGATVRFLIDAPSAAGAAAYDRTILLFDAADSDAAQSARQAWSAMRAAGLEATYWRQDARGRWAKQE
jgi:DNA polymerase-3 subunit chi